MGSETASIEDGDSMCSSVSLPSKISEKKLQRERSFKLRLVATPGRGARAGAGTHTSARRPYPICQGRVNETVRREMNGLA